MNEHMLHTTNGLSQRCCTFTYMVIWFRLWWRPFFSLNWIFTTMFIYTPMKWISLYATLDLRLKLFGKTFNPENKRQTTDMTSDDLHSDKHDFPTTVLRLAYFFVFENFQLESQTYDLLVFQRRFFCSHKICWRKKWKSTCCAIKIWHLVNSFFLIFVVVSNSFLPCMAFSWKLSER